MYDRMAQELSCGKNEKTSVAVHSSFTKFMKATLSRYLRDLLQLLLIQQSSCTLRIQVTAEGKYIS